MRDRLAHAPRLIDAPERASEPAPETLVELLVFAYRDFVGEPDRVLERYGFGRAHHRVLHFVNRHPGLTIAGLLDILDITKQSLARVLRDLVAGGFIEQRSGDEDRRQRLLHLTLAGQDLANELLALQTARIGRALAGVPLADRPAIERFLFDLIDAKAGARVAGLVARQPGGRP
jgi:DNA-binding MarR family transcriptional regulator